MANLLSESDNSPSSRRLAAYIFPSILYLFGLILGCLSIVNRLDSWYSYGFAGLLVIAGLVLQLWLFNLINVTNVQEIIAELTAKKGDKCGQENP
jgi:hypothetical protein